MNEATIRMNFGSTDQPAIVALLRSRFPSLLSAYAFGSRARGEENLESDLDLAILVAGRADLAGCDVDLLDLRAASTVMQHQVITRGRRLWAKEPEAGLFECMVLSEKTALDEARAPLIADIEREGRIHGR